MAAGFFRALTNRGDLKLNIQAEDPTPAQWPSVPQDVSYSGRREEQNSKTENAHCATRMDKFPIHFTVFPSHIFSHWCWFSRASSFLT